MYVAPLYAHNFVRWLVLTAAVVALITAYRGWLGKLAWDKRQQRLVTLFPNIFDLQILLGLILYFVSPLVRSTFGNFGAAMGNEQLRFFAVEHIGTMLIGLVLARVGIYRIRRAPSDVGKFRQAAIWYSLSALAIVFAIPWWRPLLRGL